MAVVNGIDLSQFDAAGVVTIIQDQTVQAVLGTNEIVVLVPGFSRRGSFNTGILIRQGDQATAESLYGGINRKLERNGSFFHRSLQVALQNAPVIALNLLNLNNEVDQSGQPTEDADVVPYKSFSLDVAAENGNVTDKLYASFYNKDRFWRADRKFLLATRDAVDAGSLINIVNLSQVPYSLIIRKSQIAGFDIPVKEFYEDDPDIKPAFLRDDDLISDYFIDVYVINGNFSSERFSQLAVDPIFGEFFDSNGLIAERFDDFISLPELVVRDIITGTFIPNFTDATGENFYIEAIINSKVNSLGLLCAVDVKELDKFEFGTNSKNIDLVGHNLIGGNVDNADFLSYKGKINENVLFTEKASNPTTPVDITGGGVTITAFPATQKITVVIDNTNPIFSTLETELELGNLVGGETTAVGTAAGISIASPVLRVSRLLKTATQITFDLTSPLKDGETGNSGSFVDIALTADVFTIEHEVDRVFIDGTSSFYLGDRNSKLWNDVRDGIITDGDKIADNGTEYFVKVSFVNAEGGLDAVDDYRDLVLVELFTDSELTAPAAVGSAVAFGDTVDASGFPVAGSVINIISIVGSLNQRVEITPVSDKTFTTDVSNSTLFSVGQYVVGFDADGEEILTRILEIRNIGTPAVTDIQVTVANVYKRFTAPDGTVQAERFQDFESFFPNYNPTYLKGFTLNETHEPNGTNDRIKEIYGVIENTNIGKALKDPDFINFRYLVDTFNGGLEPNSKAYLSRLVRDRQRSIAFLNTPTFEEFADSKNPRFTDAPTPANPAPTLDTRYIGEGANLQLNPDFLYTLPSEVDGASFTGFFAPNFILDDAGEEVSFPPAAAVANAFVSVQTNGSNPFIPVAGPVNGVVGGAVSGLRRMEYELFREDRGFLGKKGINPIILKNQQFQIFDDRSAFQRSRSILNRLSARDALISFEIASERLLAQYIFTFNDANVRTEVLTLLDNYYTQIQTRFGAIASFELQFNDQNNPDSLSAASVGLVDTRLRLPDINRVFVNRITLFRNNTVSSGGFVAV